MSVNNLKHWLHQACIRLQTISDSPRLDAELLLAHCLDYNRSQLITRGEEELTKATQTQADALCQRRERGEPMAYLLGNQEFWSLSLHLSPDTLIPRPDTELLVDSVLQQVKTKACRLVDLGTGSGAIALALASERRHWEITATDNNPQTLAMAKHNAHQLGLTQVQFVLSDWFLQLPSKHFDIIVTNPPYIAPDDPHLAQLQFEPQAALVAKQQGMSDLVHIITHGPKFLRTGGWLLVEHGYEQGAACRELFCQAGFSQVETRRDLAGHERVSLGQF